MEKNNYVINVLQNLSNKTFPQRVKQLSCIQNVAGLIPTGPLGKASNFKLPNNLHVLVCGYERVNVALV